MISEVSIYQWVALGLGALGFVITWTRQAVQVTRAIDAIKLDSTAKINAVRDEIFKKLAEIVDRFDEDQRTQDQRYGELVSAVRQYIINVEKEMHAIEIWGRDNYVLKSDYVRALEKFEETLERIVTDIREDNKSLNTKMDAILMRTMNKE